MKHIFGPVPSRRLGLSLGIDIVPMKTCSLSCIYCQVGKTPQTTISRQNYVPAQEIHAEIEEYLKKGSRPDWITFSGSGEPTLNSGIGEMIRFIKSLTDIPVCVITNGTLLWKPEVRCDILSADVVMPSLDSALDKTFNEICRPHPDLKLKTIIDGLVQFRKEYQGKLWLEILFAAGINDSPKELDALYEAVTRISPDAVHLNTVVRPPAESFAQPVSLKRLKEIRDRFGEKAAIIASFDKDSKVHGHIKTEDVREYLRRRPGNIMEISIALRAEISDIKTIIDELYQSGEIEKNIYLGKHFWEYIDK